jgi:hypothetical protein
VKLEISRKESISVIEKISRYKADGINQLKNNVLKYFTKHNKKPKKKYKNTLLMLH